MCKNDERSGEAKGRTRHNPMHKRFNPFPRAWGSPPTNPKKTVEAEGPTPGVITDHTDERE